MDFWSLVNAMRVPKFIVVIGSVVWAFHFRKLPPSYVKSQRPSSVMRIQSVCMLSPCLLPLAFSKNQQNERNEQNEKKETQEERRQTAAVRRFLAPLRDALESLFRNSKGILDDERSFRIREQSDRITRYVEDLDLVRERILVVHEELLNRVAQEQNARVYLLSIVAAIFLPITFITGLFGMNVAGLPGVDDPRSFWLVAGIMTVVSAGVIVWLRLRRWL